MAPTATRFDPWGSRIGMLGPNYALPFDADSYATGAGGAALTMTFDALTVPILLSQIVFGYEAVPVAGKITITHTDGFTPVTVFVMPISGAGMQTITFEPARQTPASRSLVITLADGGQVKHLFANVLRLPE